MPCAFAAVAASKSALKHKQGRRCSGWWMERECDADFRGGFPLTLSSKMTITPVSTNSFQNRPNCIAVLRKSCISQTIGNGFYGYRWFDPGFPYQEPSAGTFWATAVWLRYTAPVASRTSTVASPRHSPSRNIKISNSAPSLLINAFNHTILDAPNNGGINTTNPNLRHNRSDQFSCQKGARSNVQFALKYNF